MTLPMRRYLLNKQIALEARRSAHAATRTCAPRPTAEKPNVEINDYADEHNAACNKLKREIEALALNVKMASLQPPEQRPRERPAPRDDDQSDIEDVV